MPSFTQTLTNYFAACYPAVAVQTAEEARAVADVLAAAKAVNRSVVTWSATEGAVDLAAGGKRISDTEDLQAMCGQMLQALRSKARKETVFVLRDPHTWPLDRDAVLVRYLRDFIAAGPAVGCTVVVLAPEFKPHPTVEKLVTVLDYTLPGPEDLAGIAAGVAKSAEKPEMPVTPELVRAAGGLTTTEAENAFALSVVETGGFDPAVIYREKVLAVKRSGLLSVIDPDPRGLEAIGGLENLKTWLGRRRRAWSEDAAKFGIAPPKGIMLVGAPGTGKSLCGKVIGTVFGAPTIKLDVGALFNSLVGESEARTREALKLAEAMAPCILWIDEIDKGFAGAGGSSGDGGVGRRVFGTVISWMQERRRPVFLVASANDVSGLPPELLRKGRFDELFAVDLPSREERIAILRIQLRARGRDVSAFDVSAVADAMADFTGSEVEAVVSEALFRAFDAGRELESSDLVTAAGEVVPLAVTAKEQIEGIRRWAADRARPASAAPVPNGAPAPAGTRRLSTAS